MAGTVTTRIEGSTGWIIFDHPERHNAMTVDMWRAVRPACEALNADTSVRVVVLTGAGTKAFVAGADISQFAEERQGDGALAYDTTTDEATAAIEAIEKPVVASIHGFCIGGGLALALSADLRYAADDARFGLPPARLGIGYGAAGTGKLVDLVGPSVTKELIYTADWYDADTALRWGLINAVVAKDELDGFVADRAAVMATRAPLSQRAAKLAVADHLRPADRKQTEQVEDAIGDCFRSDDYSEGVAAFLAKRTATFTGR